MGPEREKADSIEGEVCYIIAKLTYLVVQTFRVSDGDCVTSIALDKDCSHLAGASQSGSLRIFRLDMYVAVKCNNVSGPQLIASEQGNVCH